MAGSDGAYDAGGVFVRQANAHPHKLCVPDDLKKGLKRKHF